MIICSRFISKSSSSAWCSLGHGRVIPQNKACTLQLNPSKPQYSVTGGNGSQGWRLCEFAGFSKMSQVQVIVSLVPCMLQCGKKENIRQALDTDQESTYVSLCGVGNCSFQSFISFQRDITCMCRSTYVCFCGRMNSNPALGGGG